MKAPFAGSRYAPAYGGSDDPVRALGTELSRRLAAPNATADQNVAWRAEEDGKLANFVGLHALARAQAKELIEWKFQSMPHRKARALEGITTSRWRDRQGSRGPRVLFAKL
jgi:hypothetical protein